LGALKANTG